MAIQAQVWKANPFVLHNQSLLMAGQRALRMQAVAVLASHHISTRALTWLFPQGAAIFFVQQRVVCLSKGTLQPSFTLWWKQGTESGARSCSSAPGTQGTDRAPWQAALTWDTRGHLTPGVITEEAAKLNTSWLQGCKSSYEQGLAFLFLGQKLLEWTPRKPRTDSWN